jgi:hypothetical protein
MPLSSSSPRASLARCCWFTSGPAGTLDDFDVKNGYKLMPPVLLMGMSNPVIIKTFFLLLSSLGLLFLLFLLPPDIGGGDFRPYWSASYLLRMGQDFSSPVNIDSIERSLTGWRESYTMMAWFAPTGNLILLPYTLLPFTLAMRAWLLTNLVIISTSVVLIWQNNKQVWIPFIAAFGFSMTLLSLVYGQVNTLEVLGLALFLFFLVRKQDYWAGACLVLTTIKPHLVILTLPLLLLNMIRQRQWRALAGFGITTAICGVVLFVFHPSWPVSFWQLVTSGMSSLRETPSFSGLLIVAGQYTLRKWLWVIFLMLAVLIWWRKGKDWRLETLIDVSLLVGLMVAPIGWSYDQVILLLPLIHLMKWTVDGSLNKRQSILVVVVLIVANIFSFIGRLISPSEVWFFWIPLVVALVYAFAWQSRRKSGGPDISAAPA